MGKGYSQPLDLDSPETLYEYGFYYDPTGSGLMKAATMVRIFLPCALDEALYLAAAHRAGGALEIPEHLGALKESFRTIGPQANPKALIYTNLFISFKNLWYAIGSVSEKHTARADALARLGWTEKTYNPWICSVTFTNGAERRFGFSANEPASVLLDWHGIASMDDNFLWAGLACVPVRNITLAHFRKSSADEHNSTRENGRHDAE